MEGRNQLLNDIGIVGFVIVELSLYLDTHPGDRRALEYINHYAKIKRSMMQDFAKKYFPLTIDDTYCNNEWEWGMAPLPWEGECG